MTHEALIARLEKLTGPDRECDGLILETRGYVWLRGDACWANDGAHPPFVRKAHLPKYTASVDVALTLVPDGWWLQALMHAHSQMTFAGDAHAPLGWDCFVQHEMGGQQKVGRHETSPAIALTIAALKARETSKP